MSTRHGILFCLGALACWALPNETSAQQGPIYAPHSPQVTSPIWYGHQHGQPVYPAPSVVYPAPIHQNLVYPGQIIQTPHCESCPITSHSYSAQPILHPNSSQLIGNVEYPNQNLIAPGPPENYVEPEIYVEPYHVENNLSLEQPIAPPEQPIVPESSGGPESPSDISIADLEKQAQANTANRVLTIEGRVEVIESAFETHQVETNDKFSELESSLTRSDQEIRNELAVLRARMEELIDVIGQEKSNAMEKANSHLNSIADSYKKSKAEMHERLVIQAERIAELTAMIDQIQDKRHADAESSRAKTQDMLRIQADLKRAVEEFRLRQAQAQPKRQVNLDRKMKEIANIVEREVQDSVREQRERIIRSVIRQAAKELKTKKEKERQRRNRDDDDECKDGRD